MHSSSLLFLSNLFSSDMVIIVFVALLLFGGEKLPEIARGLGKGIRDFKDASEGVKREINEQINNFEKKAEEKKMEEAATAARAATETPALAEAETSAQSKIRPVENTVPFKEDSYSEPVHTESTTPVAETTEANNENHNGVPHVSNGTTIV